MSNFDSVKKFMKTFGQEVKEKAEFPNEKITSLRYDLIKEELDELKEALDKKDIKEVADALTDILYVTYGAGHAFGIDLDKCFEEVQNSNMSKLGEDGKPIYNEKGKVLKGPKYFKPNLKKFVSLMKNNYHWILLGIARDSFLHDRQICFLKGSAARHPKFYNVLEHL